MLREVSRRGGSSGEAAAGYFGKRASGRTFSTGAEGAGGFHSARKTPPPSNTKAITSTNAMVSFPMRPTRIPVADSRITSEAVDDRAAGYASTLPGRGEKE